MRRSTRLALSVVVVGVLSAFGAASASALSYSPSGTVVQSGTLTWKLDGGSPVTCAFNASGDASDSPVLWDWAAVATVDECSNGRGSTTATAQLVQSPTSVQIVNSVGYLLTPFEYPYTTSFADVGAGTFVVGDSTTPSKLVFDDTHVADTEYLGLPITWTGTLNVTTPSGGLVTIE